MSNAFWDAYRDASTTPPGTPEHDDAMDRAEQALADAETEQGYR
jgi:hypothetical protein